MKVADIQSKIADWCISSCLTSGLAAFGVWIGTPSKDNLTAPSFKTLYGLGLILIAICLASFIVRICLTKPGFRALLRIYEPYEGVWIEEYKVDEGTDGNKNWVDYRGITLIRPPAAPSPQLFGHTFAEPACYRVGMFESPTVQYERTTGKMKYAYEGWYYKRDGSPDGEAWGFGYFKFERSLNSHKRPDLGHGSFVERDNYDKKWDPKDNSIVERIPRKELLEILGKSFPVDKEDFRKLAQKYKMRHVIGYSL